MKWRLLWRRIRTGTDSGDRAKRVEQEALLRKAQRVTPLIQDLASDLVSKVSPEEITARVRAAMTLRPE